MKLFYSPFHSFIHKALVTIHEAGLWDQMTFVPTYPFRNRNGEDQGDAYSISAINPLGKVPTLTLDNGQAIYGSQAIVECIDAMSQSGKKLFPNNGPARWEALTRMAIGDTMFESNVVIAMERMQPKEQQRLSVFEWIWPKLIQGLDRLETFSKRGFTEFDIGQVGMLQGLSYLSSSSKSSGVSDPLHPQFDWTESRPNLTAWWDENSQRPSVKSHYNVEFQGDDSPEYFQKEIQKVLTMQMKEHTP